MKGREQKIFRAVKLLYILQWWTHVKCTKPRVKSHRNYGLWMIMVCQYSFTGGNKCIAVVWMLIVGDVVFVFIGTEGIWELSVFSIHIFSESKTAP